MLKALLMHRVPGESLACEKRSVLYLPFSHPTSCSSAAEIMAVLFFHTMRYKQADPDDPDNDRFVLSKVSRHGSPRPAPDAQFLNSF